MINRAVSDITNRHLSNFKRKMSSTRTVSYFFTTSVF